MSPLLHCLNHCVSNGSGRSAEKVDYDEVESNYHQELLQNATAQQTKR